MKYIDWFTENYFENKNQCEFLLEKAEIEYLYTIEQFYEACLELKKGSSGKDLLENHLKILGTMSLYGIKASIAGIKLREAIIDTYTDKTKQYVIIQKDGKKICLDENNNEVELKSTQVIDSPSKGITFTIDCDVPVSNNYFGKEPSLHEPDEK